jgi:TRAP-type C4-dicarboxylate transport system permease small subunit
VLGIFDRWLIAANRGLLAVLLALMATLVFGNVVLRYFFGHSLSWVEEVTRYMMIWLAYLGAGLAFRAGTHVAVEVVQDLLPDRLRLAARWLILLLAILFLAAVTWLGTRYALFAWRQRTPVLGVPLGAVYLAIPLGCALAVVHLLLAWRRFAAKDYEAIAGEARPAVE